MSTSTIEPREARALQVSVADEEPAVDLADGRTVVVPLAWYPRLVHGTRQERNRWILIGRGAGIHWPDLDEDISVEGLLAGSASGESQQTWGIREMGIRDPDGNVLGFATKPAKR